MGIDGFGLGIGGGWLIGMTKDLEVAGTKSVSMHGLTDFSFILGT